MTFSIISIMKKFDTLNYLLVMKYSNAIKSFSFVSFDDVFVKELHVIILINKKMFNRTKRKKSRLTNSLYLDYENKWLITFTKKLHQFCPSFMDNTIRIR